MNILHIVAGNLNAGAARGAYWLHLGLIQQGISSKILTNSSNSTDDPNVETILNNTRSKIFSSIQFRLDRLPLMLYRNRKQVVFSTSLGGLDFSKHALYDWADIVHLHWINGGFVNIRHLKKIKKPIIWTLRDMWPMTGGCHYSFNCEKFKIGCGNCPQLKSNCEYDLSKLIIRRKKNYYPKNMRIVGISPWISSLAIKSEVFSNFTINTIFNGINCNDFYPIEKKLAQKALGINTNKKIVLVGAQNIKDYYKGFPKFLEAVKQLDKDNIFLVFFGRLNNQIAHNFGFEYKNFGFINDIVSMRLIYSAADVFVAPSIMEAFGKTLAEAMACGTPVVCFNATGPKDIVDHMINGYKAKPFESQDIYNGIQWVLNHYLAKSLSSKAREKVVNTFDNRIIAKQYIDLYNTLTEER